MKALKSFFNRRFFKQKAPAAFEKTYLSIKSSKTYLKYCLAVHGVGIRMLNTLSPLQFASLKDTIDTLQVKRILDLGSGNGELLTHLCEENLINAIGIDFSCRPKGNKSCSFIKEDHEEFKLDEKFDLILSIDSSYMIGNFKKYLKNIISHLSPNASFLLFITLTDINLEDSPLIKACNSLQVTTEVKDFTQDDYEFWKKSKEELDNLNQEFVDEGHFNLWNIKYQEVLTNLDLHKYNRINRYQITITK